MLRQPADRAAKTDGNNTAATDSRQQVLRVHADAVPRVEATTAKQSRTESSSVTKAVALLLRRATKLKQRRRKKAAVKQVPVDAPRRNTRAQKRDVASKQTIMVRPAAKGTRESTKTKKRQSKPMQPTASSRRNARKGAALAVDVEPKPREKKMSARKRMRRLEN